MEIGNDIHDKTPSNTFNSISTSMDVNALSFECFVQNVIIPIEKSKINNVGRLFLLWGLGLFHKSSYSSGIHRIDKFSA
jgi:hypothetical protein